MLNGITEAELEKRLSQRFNLIKQITYPCMDQVDERFLEIGVADTKRKPTFPRLLGYFDRQTRQFLEEKIFDHFDEQEKHQHTCRIMDQGCGVGNSIKEATFDYEWMSGHSVLFEGYAVGGSLKQMTALGRARRDTPPAEEIMERPRIYHFPKPKPQYGVEQNVRLFGIAEDLHTVMKRFPYEVDLVFSDRTYMHLLAPWLAFKRTVERLAVGGVALVKTLSAGQKLKNLSGKRVNDSFLLDQLREGNHPSYDLLSCSSGLNYGKTVAVIRNGSEPFRTDIYLGSIKNAWEREESIQCVYSKDEQQVAGLLAIDRL
ncbi:hypothetical protein HY495_03740 [Candidatus Woesearchaeota archaeon]|nr:hypothetical protein [Candidatus Woesearchaeota archaeon]